MRFRLLRPLLIAAAVFGSSPRGRAAHLPGGQPPSPEQAQELLRPRPDLASQLQQRLSRAGSPPTRSAPGSARRATRSRCSTRTSRAAAAEAARGADRGPRAAARRHRGTRRRRLDELDLLRREHRRRGRLRRPRSRDPLPTAAPARLRGRHRGRRAAARPRRWPTRPGSPVSPALGDRAADRDRRARQRPRGSGRARQRARDLRARPLPNTHVALRPEPRGPGRPELPPRPRRPPRPPPHGRRRERLQPEVTREGFIVVPQAGQLYVANLTLGQLESCSSAARAHLLGHPRGGSTRFSVSVARLRTNQVFVVGDVLRPGSYRVSSAGTALTALYAAGGPSEAGSLRRIEIRRGGRTVDVLDVYDYLTRGDASRDVRLQNGDVVFVPPRLARVRALGEVLRPAPTSSSRASRSPSCCAPRAASPRSRRPAPDHRAVRCRRRSACPAGATASCST